MAAAATASKCDMHFYLIRVCRIELQTHPNDEPPIATCNELHSHCATHCVCGDARIRFIWKLKVGGALARWLLPHAKMFLMQTICFRRNWESESEHCQTNEICFVALALRISLRKYGSSTFSSSSSVLRCSTYARLGRKSARRLHRTAATIKHKIYCFQWNYTWANHAD